MNTAFSKNIGNQNSEHVLMQTNKLKTLLGVGAIQKLHASYSIENRAWTLDITYSGKNDDITEALERQRGGTRTFALLDGIAGYLAELGVYEFGVDATGYEK